jgi:hypothetical protein
MRLVASKSDIAHTGCEFLDMEDLLLFEFSCNYIAGLEKSSRNQAPTALRIPLVASLADDLVGVVAEALTGCESTT